MTGAQLRRFRESRNLTAVEFGKALADAVQKPAPYTAQYVWLLETERRAIPGWLPYVLGLRAPMS
jgi:hypothetical protein